MQDFEAAVDAAINEMPESFVLKTFLISNQAEVKGMFLSAYDEEKDRAKALKEQERLIEEAKQEAELQVNERVAQDMLHDGKPLTEIIKYSKLSEPMIRQLAKSLGIAEL